MIRLSPGVQPGAPVMTRERPFDDSLNPEPCAEDLPPTRRRLLQALAGLGVGSAVFRRALAAAADNAPAVTADMIRQAEWVAGLTLSDKDRTALVRGLNQQQREFEAMRAVPLPNHVPPAL